MVQNKMEKERIPMKGPDDYWAEELALYIMNDRRFYDTTRRPLALNYARKKVQGTFNKELAVKGLKTLTKEGVKAYEKEFRKKLNLPPYLYGEIAENLLQEMMPEINDYARTMSALKKAGKPWTMTGGK